MRKLITLSSPIAIRVAQAVGHTTRLVSVVEAVPVGPMNRDLRMLLVYAWYDSTTQTMQELPTTSRVEVGVRQSNIRSVQEVSIAKKG